MEGRRDMDIREELLSGQGEIGIGLGSTRIKTVLVTSDSKPVASGSHTWENRYENGVWTYSLEDIWTGLQESYADLRKDVKEQYGVELKKIRAIGFSAMMHGYLAFDEKGELLVPFRTWRNTITGEAADVLTEAFDFNIPQRWSIAHLYQAILNKEEHVGRISYLTTLAGYIHLKMTGRKVLGIGDASGMFPIDSLTGTYDETMMRKFDELTAPLGYGWKLADILPEVLVAGEDAGTLTEEGAKLLDISGNLEAGALVCPPEGDAGTGMTATNSVAVRTGNVSAGTSIFAMVVLEDKLKSVHREIDVVTTPVGDSVAMVHCNNCTSDINAWAGIFKEFLQAMGIDPDMNQLYTVMFKSALKGDADCGGLMGYNYFSGEPVTGFSEGRPLFVRSANAEFSFANFMRLHLYNAVSALKYGVDILLKEEEVSVDCLYGHGGYFKTPEAGQKILSAALGTPITVMETAGEGGAWGIAVLALYAAAHKEGQGLADYLKENVFKEGAGTTLMASEEDIEGFNVFMESSKKAFPIEQAAITYVAE